ncbi:hypothetical protein Belba_2983 [Belliella baltica DSM 15883]|uniref:Carboxypeptidase-like regulatory domain-containing protein n=1 Tax=Belliella baltica (strain DSM 15883 / CIP 108006 / LMG 21964 / BA134) TaxID=866536 RepID=I3Z8D7_BELBD|nr:carboxypeptidase-like regulatory domain-containing protein [Belliella baltica]AFL85505.1 hypothetical protein Belba_2983 [Belliella baltica DSM 15883]
MKLRFYIAVFSLFFFPEKLIGQSFSGKLIDSITKLPISYAHIFVENTNFGTVSNELGEFEIPEKKLDKSIVITHINYEPLVLQLNSHINNEILMFPSTILLDEVVVNDLPYKIAQNIFTQLQNTKDVTYGKGFYRQISKQDSLPTEFIESFYNLSYNLNGVEEISISQARFARKKTSSGDVIMNYTNFSYLTFGHKIYGEAMSTSIGRPFASDFFDYYRFYLIRKFKKNEDIIFEIGFEPEFPDSLKIMSYGSFIYNFSNETLLNYRSTIEHSLGFDQFKELDSKSIKIQNPKYVWNLKFDEFKGNLKHLQIDFTYELVIDNKHIPSKVNSNFLIYQELSKTLKKLRNPSIELENVSIFEKAKYKPKFWKDNPIIKLTPEEDSIISTFEKNNYFGSYFK